VQNVIEMAKKVTNNDFPVVTTERRAGDSPVLVADSMKLKQKLGWKPRYDDLEYIIRTAGEWERKQQAAR